MADYLTLIVIKMKNKSEISMVVRPFEKKDRESVRTICCETGFLGNPIDPIFEDRELFADYLTRYYTDIEPESAWVLEMNGRVSAYVIGCQKPLQKERFEKWHNLRLFFKGLIRYFRYNQSSRKFAHWILTKGRKETPYTPPNAAHFHMNALAPARSIRYTRELINAFLKQLVHARQKIVYGQIVVFGEKRTAQLFKRYGFNIVDQIEITKYRDIYPDSVYLYTVMRDLTDASKEDPLLVEGKEESTLESTVKFK